MTERDRSSKSASSAVGERSRSGVTASLSIGAEAYPARPKGESNDQLSRFSLIFAALPRSSRR